MSMTEFAEAPGTVWPTILDCAPPPYRDLLRCRDGFRRWFPRDARPPKVCVVVGSAGATSALHADPMAWTGWHLLISGEKTWRFWADAEAGDAAKVVTIADQALGNAGDGNDDDECEDLEITKLPESDPKRKTLRWYIDTPTGISAEVIRTSIKTVPLKPWKPLNLPQH